MKPGVLVVNVPKGVKMKALKKKKGESLEADDMETGQKRKAASVMQKGTGKMVACFVHILCSYAHGWFVVSKPGRECEVHRLSNHQYIIPRTPPCKGTQTMEARNIVHV